MTYRLGSKVESVTENRDLKVDSRLGNLNIPIPTSVGKLPQLVTVLVID